MNLNKVDSNQQKIKKGIFSGKVFVFTGFRDSSLKERIENKGGIVKDTLNSKTDFLIVKDKESGSSKIKKAEELMVKIMTKDEIEEKV